MTRPITRRMSRHATNPASQLGATLIEVLLAVVIGGVIMGPLVGWILVGYRQQDTTQRRIADDFSTNLLETYFTADVQNGSVITAGGDDCPGGKGAAVSGDPERVLLFSAVTADGSSRVAYTINPGTDPTPRPSLYRRVCKVTPGPGDTTRGVALATNIGMPTGATLWSEVVTCSPRSDRGAADTCGQVTLRFTGRSAEQITLSATKRVGAPWPP